MSSKKDVYNAKIKNIGDKILDITNLATTTALNAKINEIQKMPNITTLATYTILIAVDNKSPDHSRNISTSKVNSRNFFCKIRTSKFSKQVILLIC